MTNTLEQKLQELDKFNNPVEKEKRLKESVEKLKEKYKQSKLQNNANN